MAENIFGTPPKVVRSIGDLKSAEVDGKTFYRQQQLYLGDDLGIVKCSPMDNEFIFVDGRRKGWTTFCTCGSPAVIVGYDVYSRDASAQGMMLVCYHHAAYGVHLGGHN